MIVLVYLHQVLKFFIYTLFHTVLFSIQEHLFVCHFIIFIS